MSRPFFSIVIATYNSGDTLEYTLRSIREQTIDPALVEVLVADGGSADDTLRIAEAYGATVLRNPRKLPEYAKAVGTEKASGVFLMRMDSDEEFSYPDQLKDKMELLKRHPEVRMLISNRILSGKRGFCGIAANYMNTLGDPFSYFVYRTKKDKIHTYRRNIVRSEGRDVLMRFGEGDILPLADSATCALGLDYMREHYPEEYTEVSFICGAYDRVLRDTGMCAVLRGDDVLHNCRSSLRVYFSKLKFRVINNLFHQEESGYSVKESISGKLRRRKYLFGLYALLVPLPLLDSVRLAAVYRDPTYLLHFVYVYYVCFQVFRLGVVRLAGGTRRNGSYGG
ncbi:MAG: glycosyltransferase family 2 protein [Clostridia bacterium]|nr:glycosyltransferase family 2 protein [Clostridia bacterium]